ncbi:Zinc finger BED domain-containing protein RICESLEEPER 1 [Bienertia sinuspersici]
MEYITARRKRKKRFKVWKELEEEINAHGESIAKCKHCSVELSAHRDRGTSHLKRHIDSCVKRHLGLMHEDDSDGDNFVFDMNELRNC